MADPLHDPVAAAFGCYLVIPPPGHGSASWHPASGLSTPVSQMHQPPLPPSIAGKHGPAVIVRVGPAGGDVAKLHLHHGGSTDSLIEAAALSLRQAAMLHGALDPARYTAWIRQRLAFLSEIPDAAAMFGTIEFAQHTIDAVMAHRAARGGAAAQEQGRSVSSPVPPSMLSSRPSPPPNALLPVARAAVPASPNSSLFSR